MSDVETIKKLFEEYTEKQAEQHKQFAGQIRILQDTVKPIADVYASLAGFGNITKWIFQWLIIPISVVIGIVISIRKLIH